MDTVDVAPIWAMDIIHGYSVVELFLFLIGVMTKSIPYMSFEYIIPDQLPI